MTDSIVLCPLCRNKMRINHYKDLVCSCQGKILDLKNIEELIKPPETLHQIEVYDGFNTVAKCEELKNLGFKWDAKIQKFKKVTTALDIKYLSEYLPANGFKLTTTHL